MLSKEIALYDSYLNHAHLITSPPLHLLTILHFNILRAYPVIFFSCFSSSDLFRLIFLFSSVYSTLQFRITCDFFSKCFLPPFPECKLKHAIQSVFTHAFTLIHKNMLLENHYFYTAMHCCLPLVWKGEVCVVLVCFGFF